MRLEAASDKETWAASWQNQQNDLCAQWRFRSAWASAHSDQGLCCCHEEALGLKLPTEHTAKILIRLGGWPGWSESLLGAQVTLLFLSCAAQMSMAVMNGCACIFEGSQTPQCYGFFSHEMAQKKIPNHLMRLWYFLSSINSFFKCACAAIHDPVELDVWFLVRPFVYFHTSCVQTVKALVRLCGCAGLPEPSLVAYVVSTIISWTGSEQTFFFVFITRCPITASCPGYLVACVQYLDYMVCNSGRWDLL